VPAFARGISVSASLGGFVMQGSMFASSHHWPLAPATEFAHCKICNTASAQFDHCDINQGGPPDALARAALGQSIHFYRCPACGLMFTPQLDHWQPEQYRTHIYNDSYIEVDPDYTLARPMAQASMLKNMLQFLPPDFSLLDYGAGSGILAQQLNKMGIHARSEDPYSLESLQTQPTASQLFNVVCAFEVLEHSSDPLKTLAHMRERLKPGACMIVSTLLQPEDIITLGCKWWYCAPRNGHITIFSKASLSLAFQHTGAKQWVSQTPGLHVAYFP
jgi:SAM-dependent methyltransferase